jgi:Peroxide stress protein YaaA
MSIPNSSKPGTLFIFPCCADKCPHGTPSDKWSDPLTNFVSSSCYHDILSERLKLLQLSKSNPNLMSEEKFKKNATIVEGPDFGKNNPKGKYLPAIERYIGYLYSASHDFKDRIGQALIERVPHLLILSALYGPLHTFSLIQDYNLKMDYGFASRTWKCGFAAFLRDYVIRNKIKFVRLYFGRTTKYLEVAREAISPLRMNGTLKEAIYYDVKDGNSRETQYKHGLQLMSDLCISPG